MKHINSLQDLQSYGVNILTGEADRYSFRLLCDLNEAGVDLVSKFLGEGVSFPRNWNSQVNGQPAVGSIMLSADTLWELARFALFYVDNCDLVVKGNGLSGMNYDNKYTEGTLVVAKRLDFPVYRNYAKSSTAPGSGSRNEHAFTGRTV